MIFKILRYWRWYRNVTVIWSFQTGLEKTTVQAGPGQLSTLLYSQLILNIHAANERAG